VLSWRINHRAICGPSFVIFSAKGGSTVIPKGV
jgi:hypothetical protein